MNLDPLIVVICLAFVVVVIFLAFWIRSLSNENTALKIQNATMEAELKAQKEGNERLKDDMDEQGKKLELKLNANMEHNL